MGSRMTPKLKTIHDDLKAGSPLTEAMRQEVKAEIASMGGESLFQTLFSGTNIVRFMIAKIAPSAMGSWGEYAEGVDTNESVALQNALTFLNELS